MSHEYGLLAEQKAQTEVARSVLALLPEDATRIELTCRVLTSIARASFRAWFPDGRKEWVRASGRFDSAPVHELRRVMYRDGAGTWFSMKMSVTADGAMDADFNYDDEPDFGMSGVDPVAYVNDAKEFPRDLEHQPDWLKKRLEEGQARINASNRE